MDEISKAKETLKKAGYIMFLWHQDDIYQKAEEMDIVLSVKQMENVKTLLENKTDCNFGINWDEIENRISEVI